MRNLVLQDGHRLRRRAHREAVRVHVRQFLRLPVLRRLCKGERVGRGGSVCVECGTVGGDFGGMVGMVP